MKKPDLILGVFFSDQNNLVYEHFRLSEMFSIKTKINLKLLANRLLGPIYFTAAYSLESDWHIDLIESSISLFHDKNKYLDVMQSFFILNSSQIIPGIDEPTNVLVFIGSPYTEDIYLMYDILTKYIHPSIIETLVINNHQFGLNNWNPKGPISKELKRASNLIESTAGQPRKSHWKKPEKYICIALNQRKISDSSDYSYFYTIYEDDPLRKKLLEYIPGYYIIAILPEYYENRIQETFSIYNREEMIPHITTIRLSDKEKELLYMEDFEINHNRKKSYGLYLLPCSNLPIEGKPLSFYKHFLIEILENKHDFNKEIRKLNTKINSFDKFNLHDNVELNQLQANYDEK